MHASKSCKNITEVNLLVSLFLPKLLLANQNQITPLMKYHAKCIQIVQSNTK